jgi:hypothetical protein
MAILRLPEPIDVITPIGRRYAAILETNCDEYHRTVVFPSGALVTFLQQKIRFARSYTHARGISEEEMREIVTPTSGKRKSS